VLPVQTVSGIVNQASTVEGALDLVVNSNPIVQVHKQVGKFWSSVAEGDAKSAGNVVGEQLAVDVVIIAPSLARVCNACYYPVLLLV